jgi:hypothetical protein
MPMADRPLLDSRYIVGLQFSEDQEIVEVTYGEPYDRGEQAAIVRTVMITPEVGRDEFDLVIEAVNDLIDKAVEHIRETRQDMPR